MPLNHIFVIAQVAATSGYDVTCMDVMPAALEKARAAITKSTTKLLNSGTITTAKLAAAPSKDGAFT